MELNNYFPQFLFNLYNVNCSDFVFDDENQYCIIQGPSITIVQVQNELINNVNCDNCLLGCLDLSTGNSILYLKCIDQVSSRYFNELKRVRDLLTGETVVIGETLGNAMTAEPTGISLEEIQSMFVLIIQLKLSIYSNLSFNCKIRNVDLRNLKNNKSIEASVISIMKSLIQSNSKLLRAFEWLINANNPDTIEHPYRFYANLVEMIERRSENIEMWNDISKHIVLGDETLEEFCSRIKRTDDVQNVLRNYYKLGDRSNKIIIYENYFNANDIEVFKRNYQAAKLGLI